MPATFIPQFCPSLQKEILFVRQTDGSYAKYRFNAVLQKFKKFQCSDCHLETSERDLQVISYQWSMEHGRYVIQAKNQLTGRLGSFVYDGSQGFREILLKDGHQNPIMTSGAAPEVIFTVDGFNGVPATSIFKDSKGFLRRQRFNEETQRFEVLPGGTVKMLDQERIQKPQKIQKLEKPEKINKNPGEMCNLERWLSQCVLAKPRNSKGPEIERNRQLEALFRCRDLEYAYSRAFQPKTNQSIIKISPKPENPPPPAPTFDCNDDEPIYEEYTRKDDVAKDSGASGASEGFRTPENGSEKRKIRSGDVSIIRKLARIMGNALDSEKIDETIVYEEEIYEMGASERTV